MLNQTILNSDTRVLITVPGTLDSGVSLTVFDKNNNQIIASTPAQVDGEDYYYDIPASNLLEVGTITIQWDWEDDSANKQRVTRLDVLSDSKTRYCYQYEVQMKVFDLLLPSTLNLGEYTRRASNEIERALQGLYVLPLEPSAAHANYEQDMISLQGLCADIAAGYLVEDLSISRGSQGVNMKKNAAFAELNRYAKLEKVFESIPQNTTHAGLAYQLPTPRIDASGKGVHVGRDADPFDRVYHEFTPD